jgi:hypothetical protein
MLIPLPIIILGSHLAVADVVPNFDIEQNCRLNLSGTTAPGPDVDKAMKSCVSDEQQARDQLQKQWSQFPGQGRAHCAAENNMAGPRSYVVLLTCLQIGTWAR